MRLRSAIPVIAILVLVTAVSFTALANPRPVDKPSAMELGWFYLILFCVNLLLNLFWYSLILLLVLDRKGAGIARIDQGRARFLLAVLASVVVVTILGVIIDRSLLYEEDNGWLYFFYDGGRWAAAATLVGLSVLASSFVVMRMRLRYCLLPAAGMTAMNLLWWGLIESSGIPEFLCTPGLFLVLVPFVLYELDKWHRKQYGGAAPGPSDVAGHPDGV